jgi:hypothetical protein
MAAGARLWRRAGEDLQIYYLYQANTGDGGGAEGNRTPDLLIANEALSQLSYSPIAGSDVRHEAGNARGP